MTKLLEKVKRRSLVSLANWGWWDFPKKREKQCSYVFRQNVGSNEILFENSKVFHCKEVARNSFDLNFYSSKL